MTEAGESVGCADAVTLSERASWRKNLRQTMLARRESLSASEYARRSRLVCQHVQDLLSTCSGVLLGFCWPYRQEPDILPMIYAWQASGGKVALPVVLATDQPLVFRTWELGAALQKDRYGIPTPVAGENVIPDILLLPVNAFDAAGYRLGYGGGYFDRTLAMLQPRPYCIGLGFDFCQVPSIHPEAHDQALDCIVTDAEVLWVEARKTGAITALPQCPAV